MVKAWYVDKPAQVVSPARLARLGVLHWQLDADNYEKEGKLEQICRERGYKNRDQVS